MLETNMGNKTILITGATSGIGEAIAKQFAAEGARIVAVGRNTEKLAKLQQEYPDHIFPFRYDFMDLENIVDIFNFCRNNDLKLDGLVHSAGVVFDSAIRANMIEQMEQVMKVNYFAFMELGKFFSMKKYSNDGSSIVAISSISALLNPKGLSQYAPSKAALNSLVKVMSKEFWRRKIRVNAILPGNVDTAMFRRTEEEIENYKEDSEARQPLGIIEPGHIGYLAEFLLSDNAKYMTGELIVMSGGLEY